MEIANLIIGILSLLATIAISFVIYFLEKKNNKMREEYEIKEQARKFIIDNADERDYLHWATIASGCFPQNKHKRKIYNNFTLLNDEVKNEVLKQANLDIELINGFDWVDDRINLLRKCIKQMGVGDDLLYDGAKYFHRLYDYKDEDYEKYRSSFYNHELYDDVFGFERIIQRTKGKVSFSRYYDDYLYCKYKDETKFKKEFVKPLDYMLYVENIRSCEEDYACFWIGHLVELSIGFSIQYCNISEKDHVQTDASIDTFEDRYFEILYELYYFGLKNGK